MIINQYRTGTSAAATATAILLSLPPVGDARSTIVLRDSTKYYALGDVGELVAAAVSARNRVAKTNESVAPYLIDAADRLVTQSQSLETDFAAVIDREFWKLL